MLRFLLPAVTFQHSLLSALPHVFRTLSIAQEPKQCFRNLGRLQWINQQAAAGRLDMAPNPNLHG
jgi:hypothetical protein